MAETQKTYANLIAALADNSSGAITEEGIRDLLKSLMCPFGSCYFQNNAAETAITQDVYMKVLGTYLTNQLRDFTHSDGKLIYDGVVPNHMHVATTISFTASGNNKVICFKLAKNGVEIDGSKTPRKVGTGTDVGSIALHWDVMMNPADYLEMFVTNSTDSTNVTVEMIYMFVLGMLM